MQNTLEFYNEHELINRVWDREDIQEVMAKRCYYGANEERRREIDELWVTKPENRATASFGGNWGWYVGMDSIVNHYVAEHDRRRSARFEACCKEDSSIDSSETNIGLGCMSVHPISTPLIQIAWDGKTAQGLWYSVAQDTRRLPEGGAEALWIGHKVGADLIKEDGQWKIWRLVEIYDLRNPVGREYGEQPVITTTDDPSLSALKEEFGAPDVELLTHDARFNWSDEYPKQPVPYATYSQEMGLGPKGHPRYKEVGAE